MATCTAPVTRANQATNTTTVATVSLGYASASTARTRLRTPPTMLQTGLVPIALWARASRNCTTAAKNIHSATEITIYKTDSSGLMNAQTPNTALMIPCTSSTHQRSKVERIRTAEAMATIPSTSAYAAMNAVSTTTVAPGHMSASTPNTIAARPRSKNSHQ